MKAKNKELVIEQLDSKLAQLKILKSMDAPQKGWIRAVRDALNMNGRQYARRLKLKDRSSVTLLERNEASGAATIKTMRNAAQALNCVFVYGLVPVDSLKDTIRRQAEQVAKEKNAKAAHTMLLEEQQLDKEEEGRVYKSMVEDLVKTMPKALWD